MASTIPSVKLNSGYHMPVIGYGTFNDFKANGVRDATLSALSLGYRHIDAAWVYKTEDEVGEAITTKIKEKVIQRSDLFITSKLWNTYHHPKDVEAHCRDSLRSIRTDYLDLYLMHWPYAVEEAPDGSVKPAGVDFVDTWRAMEELVVKGLVRSIGVSNFNVEQLKRLLGADNLRYRPAVNQVEMHPYFLYEELLNFCKQENIVITAYSPLGRSGVSDTSEQVPNVLEDEVIVRLAKRYNKTPAQIILRWLIDLGCTAVPKSVTPSRIKQNIEIFDFKLTEEEVKTIIGLDRNFKIITQDMFKHFPEYPFTWLLPKA